MSYGSVDAYLTTYFMLYVQFDLLAFEDQKTVTNTVSKNIGVPVFERRERNTCKQKQAERKD